MLRRPVAFHRHLANIGAKKFTRMSEQNEGLVQVVMKVTTGRPKALERRKRPCFTAFLCCQNLNLGEHGQSKKRHRSRPC